MSRVERKEYQETKIMRTMSPTRGTRGSLQNLAEFDQNLDYLLEDLQSSVSRPGSSLGTYRENSRNMNSYDSSLRSNSLNRITNLKPQNPLTDYSSDDAYSYTSPDGRKSVKAYKKESYTYKTNVDGGAVPEKSRMQNNIHQLDSLLDNLQQVKQSSTESRSYNSSGVSPTLQDQNVSSSKRTVQRELHYGEPPRSSSRGRTLERSDRENSVTRDIEYIGEGNYGDLRTVRHTSPSPSRSSTLSRQTKVTNMHSYPLEVVETTTPDINPEILASLDPNLLPAGNTKVTTTIKTYTYEIPGAGTSPGTGYPSSTAIDTEKYIYSPNQTLTTPSKSFVYNKVENNTLTRNVVADHAPLYQKPTSPASPSGNVVKEVVTTRNYQPGHPGFSPHVYPEGQQTYIYNETTTTKNYNQNQNGYPGRDPPQHPRQDTYIIKETRNNTNTVNEGYPNKGGQPHYPPNNNPPSTTYIYKETHNTNTNTNTNTNPNQNYPHHARPEPSPKNTTVIYNKETHNTNVVDRGHPKEDAERFDPNYPPYPNAGKGRPNEPINVTYKFSSQSTTTNKYKGGGYPQDEREPLIQHPNRFPTDNDVDGPPKRLDDLMATMGHEPPNSPLNAGFNHHEAELAKQRKVDSLKQQHEDVDKREPKDLQRTKNVSGPPVYYPPGHEMFAKKEESGGGAWRAEGAMAKESGKYKYEAESKSKSKSKSGAAIVPVCLPLCCGLPCTIL